MVKNIQLIQFSLGGGEGGYDYITNCVNIEIANRWLISQNSLTQTTCNINAFKCRMKSQ